MDPKIVAIIILGVSMVYLLYTQLFPSEGVITRSESLSQSTSSTCSSTALSAKEADHAAGVALRKQLVSKWAPQGSVDTWDEEIPLDEGKAWNAPTIWDIWAPTYGCHRPVHVGGVGSSQWATMLPLESKAVCNPQQMKLAKPCTIYSFGVGWDTTFEISMTRIAPNCKVRVFDPTVNAEKFWELVAKQTPDGESPPKAPQLDFVQVGLAAKTTDEYSEGMLWNNKESIKVKTLEDIMKSQGDEKLSILKVDIEGSEWTALPQACESGAMAKVDQLLLEVHLGGCEPGYKENNRGKLSKLFSALERSGMRAFSNIPNLVPVSKGAYPGCAEYSFVNKNGPFVKDSCGA